MPRKKARSLGGVFGPTKLRHDFSITQKLGFSVCAVNDFDVE